MRFNHEKVRDYLKAHKMTAEVLFKLAWPYDYANSDWKNEVYMFRHHRKVPRYVLEYINPPNTFLFDF